MTGTPHCAEATLRLVPTAAGASYPELL